MTEKRGKGLPANYSGGTREEVALAARRYRPGKKKQAGSPTTRRKEKRPSAGRR